MSNKKYPPNIFLDKVPNYFICTLCKDYFRGCVSTPCFHKFCQSCLTTFWIKSGYYNAKKACPTCHNFFEENKLVPDKWIDKQIDDLHVICPKKKSCGCNWKGLLCELPPHETSGCEFRLQKCKYEINGCLFETSFKKLDSHTKDCQYRMMPCEYCSNNILMINREDHLKNHCVKFPISCPSCKERMERGALAFHTSNVCPITEICCNFAMFGCTEKVPRKSMDKHLKKCVNSHLTMAFEKICILETQISRLKDDLHGMTSQKMVGNDVLLKENINLEYTAPQQIIWEVPPFSHNPIFCEEDVIVSPKFRVQDITFQILFYPFGKNGSSSYAYMLRAVSLVKPAKVDFCLYHDGCDGKPFSTSCSMEFKRVNDEHGWLGVTNKDEIVSHDYIRIKCLIQFIEKIVIN